MAHNDKDNIAILEKATGVKWRQQLDGSYKTEKPLTRQQTEAVLALSDLQTNDLQKAVDARAAFDALVGKGSEDKLREALIKGQKVSLTMTPEELDKAKDTLTNPRCTDAIRESLGTDISSFVKKLQAEGRTNDNPSGTTPETSARAGQPDTGFGKGLQSGQEVGGR